MNAPTPAVYIAQAPSNGLGTAGFVLSLVGWFTCGVLSPIGAILSFAALFGAGKPKGLAIAGLIIGGLGTAFLAIFGLAFIFAALGTSAPTAG